MTVFFNGVFTPSATISAFDRGFLLGDGAFETLFVDKGVAAFAAEHLQRLSDALDLIRLPKPAALNELPAIIAELARRDGVEGAAAARVTISRGHGPRGLALPERPSPTLLVSLSPYRLLADGAALIVSARRRYSGASAAAYKSLGGYGENILALDDARRAGADDALMLNEHGRVVSATAANVFLIDKEGAIITPPAEEGALPGVVRAILLEEAAALGVEVKERPITAEEIEGRLLFLTNSLVGLRPAALGARPAAADLAEAYHALRTCYHRRLAASLSRKERA